MAFTILMTFQTNPSTFSNTFSISQPTSQSLPKHATASENPWVTLHHAHFSSFSAKQRGCVIILLKKGVSISEVITNSKSCFIITTVNTSHALPVTVCGVYALNNN